LEARVPDIVAPSIGTGIALLLGSDVGCIEGRACAFTLGAAKTTASAPTAMLMIQRKWLFGYIF
jgi:hypothetical protein